MIASFLNAGAFLWFAQTPFAQGSGILGVDRYCGKPRVVFSETRVSHKDLNLNLPFLDFGEGLDASFATANIIQDHL